MGMDCHPHLLAKTTVVASHIRDQDVLVSMIYDYMCTIYDPIDTVFAMENERNGPVPRNQEYTEKKSMSVDVRQKECSKDRAVLYRKL